jgi:hypothetical protein
MQRKHNESNGQETAKRPSWITVSSLFIAALALVFTILENRKNQTQRQLSVRPMLSFTSSYHASDPMFDFIGIRVENRGLGPAILMPLKFYRGKNRLGDNNVGNVDALIRELNLGARFFLYTIHNLHILQPGEERKILWAPKTQASQTDFEQIATLSKEINVVACYYSLYEECFAMPLRTEGDIASAYEDARSVCDCKHPKRLRW